jgi:hypothetical protein
VKNYELTPPLPPAATAGEVLLRDGPLAAAAWLEARLDALEARLRERDEQIARLESEHRALVVACRAGLRMVDLRVNAQAASRFDSLLEASKPQEPGK